MIIYFFKSAFSTLQFHKFRTFLTGLGIFVGITSIVIIFSFSDSLSSYLSDAMSQEVTLGLVEGLDADVDFTAVMSGEDIQAAADQIRSLEDVRSFEQAQSTRTTDCRLEDESWQYDVAIAFADDVTVFDGADFSQSTGNVVIAWQDETGEETAVYHTGDTIVIDGILYVVCGVTAELSATLYFPERLSGQVPYEEIAEVAAFYLVTNAQDEDTVDTVLQMLNEALGDVNASFVNYTESDTESITGVFSTISVFLSLIASVSLIVSAINIINIMYISILERAAEIAVYRSLGMPKGMVVYLFLVESMLIVVSFSLAGYLFGLLAAWVILAFMQISLYVNVRNLFLVMALSVVLGIASGIRPAVKASDTNPSILLR